MSATAMPPEAAQTLTAPGTLDAAVLKHLCLEAGADDCGFVTLDREEIAPQRADILAAFPATRTLISLVCRMNRENIRTPMRSVANLEFHHTTDHVNEAALRLVRALEQLGIRAVNGGAAGFPMEMDRFGNKSWIVSHKPVAVAAGLGKMGIHRNVIHPKFGNFILLTTVLMDAEVSETSRPIDYNPCMECKLCVAACPVGAIGADGAFSFSACLTHNYREFMGGFSDWVQTIADSKDARDYRRRMSTPETVSMWQSLGFGPNYKAAYCMAVCPAGEDVITPYQHNRVGYLDEVLRPLQKKEETLYVIAGSDAESYAARRFPHKKRKRVHNGLTPPSIAAFLRGLNLTFQRGRSEGMDVTYHFSFTGEESRQATVIIRDRKLQVLEGHQGKANLKITADSRSWLRFLSGDTNPVALLLRGKLRLKGPLRHLKAFGACFPS